MIPIVMVIEFIGTEALMVLSSAFFLAAAISAAVYVAAWTTESAAMMSADFIFNYILKFIIKH